MLSLLLSACTDAAFKVINAPSYLFGKLRVEENLSYGDRSDQKLNLYLPQKKAQASKHLIVFLYGGGWTAGNRQNYYFVADALTAAGHVVAIPDYIKYPEGEFPAFVDDAALAIAWLADNVRQFADVDDMFIIGHSAGAHIGALLITDPRYLAAHGAQTTLIRGFVGLAGPYAFIPKEKKYRDIFANLEDYSQMQPLHFASGNEPPALLLHGEDDSTVLPANTRKFAEKINALGGNARSRYYSGKGHISIVLALSRISARSNAVRSDILDFLLRDP